MNDMDVKIIYNDMAFFLPLASSLRIYRSVLAKATRLHSTTSCSASALCHCCLNRLLGHVLSFRVEFVFVKRTSIRNMQYKSITKHQDIKTHG